MSNGTQTLEEYYASTMTIIGIQSQQAQRNEENNGLLRRFSRSVGKITLKNIEDHPDFYGQPFYRSTQSGLHTLDMNDLNE